MRTIKAILLTLILTMSFTHAKVNAEVDKQEIKPEVVPQSSKPVAWRKHTFKVAPPNSYWDRVAQCETASNWQDRGNFAGGLGIARKTWIGYGGKEFAPTPDKATKFEQIIVANRIAIYGYQTKNEYITLQDKLNNKPYFRPPAGFMGWGCIKNTVGKPKYKSTKTVLIPKSPRFYCPEFEQTFKKYGLPPKVFSYIAWKESRCQPQAVNAKWEDGKIVWTLNQNGSYDSGLLQINSIWFQVLYQEFKSTPNDLFDHNTNIKFATYIYLNNDSKLRAWGIKSV